MFMLSGIKKSFFIAIGVAILVSFMASFAFAASDKDVVAVAASIHECTNELAYQFEKQGLGKAPEVVSGASGKLASQIMAGAPFGLFLSASPEWTKKLEDEGYLYDVHPMATAPAVAWWQKDEPITTDTLKNKGLHIAIADPASAPFGKAAVEYLKSIGLYDSLMKEKRLIIMGSVEQAALAAKSGGADIGIFSLSIAKMLNAGNYVVLPIDPLENSGGLVKGKDSENLKKFWNYIRSETADEIWKKWGFEPVHSK